MSARPQNPHKSAAFPQIPGYRISRVIGDGGMSTVYLGTQLSLAREVAIKIMRAEVLTDEASRRRFENEARTIARLEHPHIVSIYEVGRTSEGQPWYSMPYLGRGHLGQRDLTHDHARIAQVLEALLSALAFAHARGVIHRDVKAENVLFDETGRPLLADFGIALRRGHGVRVTSSGLAIGSTAYMAPEQARGQQVDPRSDLYSVGVLAWEMLTGQLPYQADDAIAMALAHVHSPLPRLPPRLRHWQRFVHRALAKQPHKRFHNAEHMLAVLRTIPPPGSAHPRRWRWLFESAFDLVYAHRVQAWSGLVLTGLALLVLLFSLNRHPQSSANSEPPATIAAVAPDSADPAQENMPALLDSSAEPLSVELPPPTPRRVLRTAPTSLANQRLEQMRPLLSNKSLTPPQLRQAIDLLLAAHRADPEHLQLPAARDALLRTLSAQVVAAIEDGDDVRAQALSRQLPRLRSSTLPPPRAALDGLYSAIYDALSARIDATVDAAVAQHSLDTASLAGLPPEQLAHLRARLRALQAPPGWITVRLGDRLLHISSTLVSRAAWSRFVQATARLPSTCRERGSMLRLAPRDWSRPGFAQTGRDPVVCVSWQDAQDYAIWAGQRDNRRYRLLSMDEAAALPATADARAGGRALAEWRSDCEAGCARRMVSGRSWRSRQALRSLPVERGYPDVGFRLAIEPQPASSARCTRSAQTRPDRVYT